MATLARDAGRVGAAQAIGEDERALDHDRTFRGDVGGDVRVGDKAVDVHRGAAVAGDGEVVRLVGCAVAPRQGDGDVARARIGVQYGERLAERRLRRSFRPPGLGSW